ncbi:MAG: hypothetical protein QFC55_05820 [Chloroflexota bacterium]|nr:hypothetical protein [Chloroflexota bacterium]
MLHAIHNNVIETSLVARTTDSLGEGNRNLRAKIDGRRWFCCIERTPQTLPFVIVYRDLDLISKIEPVCAARDKPPTLT